MMKHVVVSIYNLYWVLVSPGVFLLICFCTMFFIHLSVWARWAFWVKLLGVAAATGRSTVSLLGRHLWKLLGGVESRWVNGALSKFGITASEGPTEMRRKRMLRQGIDKKIVAEDVWPQRSDPREVNKLPNWILLVAESLCWSYYEYRDYQVKFGTNKHCRGWCSKHLCCWNGLMHVQRNHTYFLLSGGHLWQFGIISYGRGTKLLEHQVLGWWNRGVLRPGAAEGLSTLSAECLGEGQCRCVFEFIKGGCTTAPDKVYMCMGPDVAHFRVDRHRHTLQVLWQRCSEIPFHLSFSWSQFSSWFFDLQLSIFSSNSLSVEVPVGWCAPSGPCACPRGRRWSSCLCEHVIKSNQVFLGHRNVAICSFLRREPLPRSMSSSMRKLLGGLGSKACQRLNQHGREFVCWNYWRLYWGVRLQLPQQWRAAGDAQICLVGGFALF